MAYPDPFAKLKLLPLYEASSKSPKGVPIPPAVACFGDIYWNNDTGKSASFAPHMYNNDPASHAKNPLYSPTWYHNGKLPLYLLIVFRTTPEMYPNEYPPVSVPSCHHTNVTPFFVYNAPILPFISIGSPSQLLEYPSQL